MGQSLIDHLGQRFGRLMVTHRAPNTNTARWTCHCDCGRTVTVTGGNLRAGTKSCGCLSRELVAARFRTHGMRSTPEYISWRAAKARCTNLKDREWRRYGGRGVQMSAEWMESFEKFFADVGPRPSPQHSLDRFPDTNGHYEPGNVRWATPTEQANNRRSNHQLTWRGETRTVAEWAKRLNLQQNTIHMRLHAGWSVERALTAAWYSRKGK